MLCRLPRWSPAVLLVIAGSTHSVVADPFPAGFDLSSLNGANGFVCNGIDAGDYSGFSVSSAGDVNGDGVDDFIIGANAADTNGPGSGASYVVFGDTSIGSSGVLELSTLNGSNGFVCNGISVGDSSGRSVSCAGDVNDDGINDLIIGAIQADQGAVIDAGEAYIIFGHTSIGAGGTIELSSLDGINGFVCLGIDAYDQIGGSVSSAGDINGDGIGDLIIGARFADPNMMNTGGESYIVFGDPNLGASGTLDLSSLNGTNGFVCNGVDAGDRSGVSVSSAGDVNGDNFDDLIIGAYTADEHGTNTGECYVIFGGNGIGASGTLELASLNGANGFACYGDFGSDFVGSSVSSAGDINGDGIGDLIIGASSRSSSPFSDAVGNCYILFGGIGIGSSGKVELTELNGTDGFVCFGVDAFDYTGYTVSSASDINGDGFDDCIVGAFGADPNGIATGASYVIYGGTAIAPSGVLNLSSLDGDNGFVCEGVSSGDSCGYSVSSAGDVNGDGIDDLVIGASTANPNGLNEAGQTYIVYGRCIISGNLNGDLVVDTADLGILIAQFGTIGPEADLNNDNTVDTADLGILIGAFGSTCN